jgi:hypothetical protein
VQGGVEVAVPVDVPLDRRDADRTVIVSGRSGRLKMSAKLDGINERRQVSGDLGTRGRVGVAVGMEYPAV